MKKVMKELGLDSQGIQKTMRGYQFFGDGISQFALNSISGLVGMLTYFYTDKVGIAAAAAGTIMIVSKIIDAFTDLIMGKFVDNTTTRFGKARPWMLWTSIPALVAIVLLFTVPSGLGSSGKFAYALATNIFATAIVYTAIAIPYGCLMALITKSTQERSKMGILRAIMGYISGMIIAIGLIPITNAFGGDQRAWIIVACIFGALSAMTLIWTFSTTREKYAEINENKEESDSKTSLSDSIKLLFKNKYWVIMLFAMLFINIVYATSGSTAIYYAKYILKNENLIALLGGVGLIPVIIGFAVTQPLVKKFGLAKTVRIALLIGIGGTIVRMFFPYSLLITLIFGAFTTFATIPLMAVGGVLVNNTIEYNEYKFGKRLVGMSNSASSFGAKIGSGLGAAMIGWILALGHYDGKLAEQMTPALNSIIVLTIWIPGVLLVGLYLLLRQYDLDIKYAKIVNELEARKQKSE
ncbi:MAG: MFS transporter [Clostridia bacterium]|nr:MFS transporter [Clostridia bacterium]